MLERFPGSSKFILLEVAEGGWGEVALAMGTMPITVATRSNKAWTVFALSNAGILVSNPTTVIDVFSRLFCICVGSGLAAEWSALQTILGIRNWSEQSDSLMPNTLKWEQRGQRDGNNKFHSDETRSKCLISFWDVNGCSNMCFV
jgi:hypothetical protein